jgi:hypothetical protein
LTYDVKWCKDHARRTELMSSTLLFEFERKCAEDYVISKGHRNVRAFLVHDRAREICVHYDGNREIGVILEPGIDLEGAVEELLKHPRVLR